MCPFKRIKHTSMQKRHAHSKFGARALSVFWAKWILKKQLPKDKKTCRIILIIFDTIMLVSVRQIISCKIQICVRWLALNQRQARLYSSAHYNHHTRLCWDYECSDQSETFRWVQGARLLADWIPSPETTKCKSVYDVSKTSISQFKQLQQL